jgi:SAM-dependent methyltransferase
VSRIWEHYGRHDPYFGVLSAPQYHGQLDPRTRDDFFRSGAERVDEFVAIASRSGSVTFGTALDFGCGVGRLSMHLAGRFRQVICVDVSRPMLAEARRNLASKPNVTYAHADELASLARADFIISSLVFQHIPPEVGLDRLASLAGLLNSGGVGVIDVPIAYTGGLTRNVLRRLRAALPAKNPVIPMYAYRREEVARALGACTVEITEYEVPRFRVAIAAFRNQEAATPGKRRA